MFTLSAVSFSVPGKTILHPISLTIPAGRITTLLGHNGSGKSTLIKLLSRNASASDGHIALGNKPLNTFSSRDYARYVAYLPQDPPITDSITVYELVRLGRYPWKGALGRYDKKDQDIIAESMEAVGVTSLADRFVSTLSGGERQRVWVAMLLAQQSDCILLDEPTSALDIAHQYELLSLIRKLNQERGLTVIMVLHDINLAARYSDNLIALHSGKVMAHGDAQSLMNQPILEAIYDIPLGFFHHPENGQPIAYVR
ncbi:ABC transporter ATP-binding protein [Enterovibrio paralichthyis]|uniref:ABC transporter ATP-binding protein n=1 Tax=Enterovibrio paralichthyis TaxID=2853805 RepID=UPI001C4919FE|nr:ATP-binding cassette domain-containing protein [Enterovibrio paralichthyis]MBV7299918.1 ATP-binding cassette domain-containing protein [Enterovibrio paralichthyis]